MCRNNEGLCEYVNRNQKYRNYLDGVGMYRKSIISIKFQKLQNVNLELSFTSIYYIQT